MKLIPTARTGLSGLLLAACLAVSAPVCAQSVQPTNIEVGSFDGGKARRVDLGIGKSVIVELPRDAKEVFVANPKVANAIVRSTRKIFVIGAADGQTNVIVMDADGRQIANLDVNVGRDLNVLRATLKAAMPDSNVTITPVGDSIVLTGSVNSAGEALQAVDIAKGFIGANQVGDTAVAGKVINSITVRGRDQVMLKVTIAEIQRVVLKQLGVSIDGNWQVGNIAGVTSLSNPVSLAANSFSATINKTTINLKAIERAGAMRTLAEPTLTAVSGESAKFLAGGEVPVPGGESCAAGPLGGQVCTVAVVYKNIGVALNFTPIVMSEGRISLHVSTEVIDIDNENQLKAGSTVAPAFKTRRLDTTVELPSGASLASAGLIQNRSSQTIGGFPGLVNLPVLGALFRSREYQRQETELMIIVTPFIAKPVSANQVVRPTDGFVEASDPQSNLLARINRLYGPNGGPVGTYKGRAGFVIE